MENEKYELKLSEIKNKLNLSRAFRSGKSSSFRIKRKVDSNFMGTIYSLIFSYMENINTGIFQRLVTYV